MTNLGHSVVAARKKTADSTDFRSFFTHTPGEHRESERRDGSRPDPLRIPPLVKPGILSERADRSGARKSPDPFSIGRARRNGPAPAREFVWSRSRANRRCKRVLKKLSWPTLEPTFVDEQSLLSHDHPEISS